MSKLVRTFLFHGSDSLASSRAVDRWILLFKQKFGSELLHTLHADELDSEVFHQTFQSLLFSQGLFGENVLILIKRPTKREKGNSGEYTKAIQSMLGKAIPESVTLVIWEEFELPATHSLLKSFITAELAGKASIKLHRLPPVGKLMSSVREELAESGLQITREADRMLGKRILAMEKSQRLLQQLKGQEVLKHDVRSWWLASVVQSIILFSQDEKIVDERVITIVMESFDDPVGIFEISNAITARSLKQARELLALWRQGNVDDADYFRLFHILRRHAKQGREHSGYTKYMLRLLAEIELLIKNGFLSPSLAADMLCLRLQHAKADFQPPIIKERVLWLATLQRSGN